MTLGAITEVLGCKLVGDPGLEITRVAGLAEAGPGDLTFLSNPRYFRKAQATRATAILATSDKLAGRLAVLVSSDPYLDFARALELFNPAPPRRPGIHPTAVVHPTASLGEGAGVGPYVVIERGVAVGNNATLRPHVVIERDARIGDDFTAHSGVTVCHGTRIGNRVTLHHGVTVGSDGFGFAKRPDGGHRKIPQTGVVVIEDEVEIQAGSCVDRAAVGETRIGRGAIVDNLVQIGHAAKIGANTILCAQVGIAGSTTIGANCVLAGQVGVINHLRIGDGTVITAQSGVGHDLPAGSRVSGSPAFDNRRWLRSTAVFTRLSDLDRQVRRLRKRSEGDDGDTNR